MKKKVEITREEDPTYLWNREVDGEMVGRRRRWQRRGSCDLIVEGLLFPSLAFSPEQPTLHPDLAILVLKKKEIHQLKNTSESWDAYWKGKGKEGRREKRQLELTGPPPSFLSLSPTLHPEGLTDLASMLPPRAVSFPHDAEAREEGRREEKGEGRRGREKMAVGRSSTKLPLLPLLSSLSLPFFPEKNLHSNMNTMHRVQSVFTGCEGEIGG